MDRRKVSNGGILLHDDSLGPRSAINPVGQHRLAWPQFGPNLESQHREQLLCREGECLYEHQKPLRVPALPFGLMTWILAIAFLIQRTHSFSQLQMLDHVGSISPSSVVHPKGTASRPTTHQKPRISVDPQLKSPINAEEPTRMGKQCPKLPSLKPARLGGPRNAANFVFRLDIGLGLSQNVQPKSNGWKPFFSQQSPYIWARSM